jgi:hypothetical protein
MDKGKALTQVPQKPVRQLALHTTAASVAIITGHGEHHEIQAFFLKIRNLCGAMTTM